MTIMILSGVPGSGKTTICNRIKDNENDIEVINLGDLIYSLAKKEFPEKINVREDTRKIPRVEYLKIQKKAAEIIRQQKKHVIVDTHLVLKTPHGYYPGLPEEILRIIKPEIICTLGNYATSFILARFSLASQIKGISQIHGKIFEYSDIFSKIKIIPLYHPAVATYNRNMEPVLRKDIEIISKII